MNGWKIRGIKMRKIKKKNNVLEPEGSSLCEDMERIILFSLTFTYENKLKMRKKVDYFFIISCS